MKLLGFLSFVLVFVSASSAQDVPAQTPNEHQSGFTIPNPDNRVIELLASQDVQLPTPQFWQRHPPKNSLVYWIGDLEPVCGAMRTYRVKREPESDVTYPSGYTTCVPMARFRIEDVVPEASSTSVNALYVTPRNDP